MRAEGTGREAEREGKGGEEARVGGGGGGRDGGGEKGQLCLVTIDGRGKQGGDRSRRFLHTDVGLRLSARQRKAKCSPLVARALGMSEGKVCGQAAGAAGVCVRACVRACVCVCVSVCVCVCVCVCVIWEADVFRFHDY